ncbi:hypothetical protein PWY87_35820 [Kribbella solani]|uniref:SpdA protein n=1 Tax=Streptomyces acidiscabies TaxID=42234 RepID=A0ABU4ME47_9ACTN|nr:MULTISPECIES: hypothetical protein [Actinomycetes]MDX2973811.1 hypothetical protein [Kribbella solani]MDX3007086.1 hypothetical protein [Kribbella solani]MDX3026151.1 hypothetical protein [Streptomyces acidiscabies]
MTTYESPRDAHGNRLCEYCGDPVPKSLGTKPKRYCKRSCRQRAYEVRKNREATIAAVAMAVARDRTSRDDGRTGTPTSRDVAKRQAAPEVPAPAPSGDFLLAPPAESPQESTVLPEAWRAPAPRRSLSRRRSGMQASAMPLPGLEPEDADGE